jgi:hypothetical protein
MCDKFGWVSKKDQILTAKGKIWLDEERCLQVLVNKPEGKRQLGKLRRRWENDNKMFLTDWGGGMD